MNIPRISFSTALLISVRNMGTCTCTTTHERMAFDCSFVFRLGRLANGVSGGMCMFLGETPRNLGIKDERSLGGGVGQSLTLSIDG